MYLRNETLRAHLLEICEALLSLDTNNAEYVMGYHDSNVKCNILLVKCCNNA